ncbi:T9SS type A sorting domain-containing protein [Kordia sp.]|uniref:T9SS type A sorting domain-containing protein n=1 Tax=Kordia sp. TaxID=1965332 RepID=UPI0025BACA0C|nr:T9SS type A sorting domain-containing protein [Kordia sp.]MCH2195894.1 T9SS type A sorting domain-containing protein [Kordia sp.]
MMKKKITFKVAAGILFLGVMGYTLSNYLVNKEEESISQVEKLRKKHADFLANSPFKETQMLSRKERKAQGLPPNAFNEQRWELTMNPNLGRPTPENIMNIERDLKQSSIEKRTPGDAMDNTWQDRGPNNIGGRTRALMFDPNDINNANSSDDYTRVFAGGVAGGLWVNEDITDANSSWQLVEGFPGNLSVTVIVSDPNDSNIMYIGSGESYTANTASNTVGGGVFKSTDGGVTWQLMIGGNTGTTQNINGVLVVDGIFYVNDVVARDNNGTTEVYATFASGGYSSASGPFNILGFSERGLSKSTDAGVNWSRFPIQFPNGTYMNPNDIELDLNNDIWVTTTSDNFGNQGGAIFTSSDGVTFNSVFTLPNTQRTELEPSSTTPGTFWIAADVGNGSQANIYQTTDSFATITILNEPNDADNGIPASDYTRQQAFYNLPIEADENDNLYVGGIDLFKYDNTANSWDQISKWSNNPGLGGLNISLVHADQHAIVFRPNDNTQAIIGNDGGVYYSADIVNSALSGNAIQARNFNYNVTQFYYGAIGNLDAADGDDIAGGTQDNGSLTRLDADTGVNSFGETLGGDGAFTDIDDDDGYIIFSFPFASHVFIPYPTLNFSGAYFIVNEGNSGGFINTAELDRNTNTFYANTSQGGTNRISQFQNINNGSGNIVRSELTNTLLNSRPSAFKTSADGQTLYVGLRNGRLLKVEAALTTIRIWSNIQDPGFVGSISDIEFGETENDLYVTFHNYGVNNVWYSPDAGVTWEQKDGDLPDIPVMAILANPLVADGAEVIIATELGVWRSSNFDTASPTWVRSDNGMRSVPVFDLDLRPSDNTVLATTHGRGFFTGQFLPGILSTEEFSATNNFSIYPTISDGNMTLKGKDSGKTTVTAYTLAGQQASVKVLNLSRNTPARLNLSELSSGIYILKIQQNDAVKTQKIVIE